MEVLNFKSFRINEEVQIKTFDLVIDESGQIIYKGQIPIKGNLDINLKRIIGDDGKEYIASIDRSGNLFTYLEQDQRGNILLDGKKVKTEQFGAERSIRTQRTYWNSNENYTEILPILPTGWVNVKIDMEVIKKIRRYSAGISNRNGVEGLKRRLDLLSKYDTKLRKRSSETIRKEMSAIMTLHYLKELKEHFDPSSAGFLFESYIAGMVTGSRVKEDNSSVDLVDKKGNTYQVKLLDAYSKSLPGITLDENNNFLSYYILGFKYHDRIKLFLLNGIDQDSKDYVGKFEVRTNNKNFSYSKFEPYRNTMNDFIFEIPLIGIEKRIEKIAEGLKETIEDLYNNLSKFQFNVETILTGVDEGGKILKEQQFVKIENESFESLINMKKELDNLIGIIKN